MNSLSADILQQIFLCIQSPIDLLQIARVSKQFYTLSRANNAWVAQEQRMLGEFPQLQALFDKYREIKALDNGKRVKLKKRPHKEHNWVMPKGIWYVFARHLLFKNISQILQRSSSRTHVVDAVCSAAITPGTAIDIVNRSHIKLRECRFQRCVCLRNFTFIWIGMGKGDSTVSVYTERQKLRIIKSSDLVHNFKHLVRNEPVSKLYVI